MTHPADEYDPIPFSDLAQDCRAREARMPGKSRKQILRELVSVIRENRRERLERWTK